MDIKFKNILIAALFFVSARAFAAANSAPHTLNFSGFLTDGSGTPLNGAGQDMIFELSVGGNIVWCAEYENITASNGMIAVTLGAAGPQVGTGGLLTPTGNATHCQSVANGGGPGGAPTPINSALLSGVTSSTNVAVNLQVNESGAWQLFASPFAISSSLFALQAESLGGGSSSFYVNGTGQLTSNGTPIVDLGGNWIGGNITTGTIPAANITGTLPATVNGSQLTGITASQIAPGGTLPAENGSNLTNLNGGAVTAGTLPVGSLAAGGTLPAENGSALTSLNASNITSGILGIPEGGTGANSTSQYFVFAGPTTGAGAPSFRALTSSDIPSLSSIYLPLSGSSSMTGNLNLGSHTLDGDSAASGNLTLDSTSSATKGNIILAPSGGNVGVGTTIPNYNLDVIFADQNTTAAVRNTSSTAARYPAFDVFDYTGGNGGFGQLNLLTARGSAASPASVLNTDYLGGIQGWGQYDTASGHFGQGAQIDFIAEGNFSNSSYPSAITFGTAPSGSTAISERMRITNAGNVGIGTANPPAKLGVSDTSAAVNASSFSVNGANGTYLQYFSNLGGGSYNNMVSAGDNLLLFGVPAGNGLVIGQNTSAGGLKIMNNGNVGIGTANPAFDLDVNASTSATARFSSSDALTGSIVDIKSTANKDSILRFYNNAPTGFTMGRAADTGNFEIQPVVAGLTGSTSGFNITTGGNVGIGVTNPVNILQVESNAAVGELFAGYSSANNALMGVQSGTNSYWALEQPNASNSLEIGPLSGSHNIVPYITILGGGNVGIGTTNPGATLDVNGTIRDTSGTVSASDFRFKKNIQTLRDPLEKILNLNGVSFEWRRDEFPQKKFKEGKDLGVIAQNVETQFPEVVYTDPDGYKSVAYEKLVSPLIEAVKALYAKFASQDQKILALQKEKDQQIADLKNENTAIKAELSREQARAAKREAEILARLELLEHQNLASKASQAHRGLASVK